MNCAILPIVDLHKFAEPTRVIVVHCLGITECLHNPVTCTCFSMTSENVNTFQIIAIFAGFNYLPALIRLFWGIICITNNITQKEFKHRKKHQN